MKSIFYIATCTLLVTVLGSCKKGWLEAPPNQSLVLPTTIGDYQALLDDAGSGTDYGFNVDQPGLDEVGANDFYMTDANYNSRDLYERNTYAWIQGDLFAGKTNIADWNGPYRRIFTANVVMEGIATISPTDPQDEVAKNNIRGQALFFRAYEHYSVAQLFCRPFSSTAESDPGVPLKLSSNFNDRTTRSTVAGTYRQIIADLMEARALLVTDLPNSIVNKNRPTKVAADAMLGRVYLAMGKYDSAYKYADACLSRYSALMNYNSNPPVNPSSLTPFPKFNNEVIFQKLLLFYGSLAASRLIVDPTLLSMYSSNDMRASCFFRLRSGVYTYKGMYDPSLVPFSGLATDEVFLIRAECQARLGHFTEAMNDLNTLLVNRWKTGTFTPMTASDPDDALQKVLTERHKELCFRGLRWTDLRRLNQDPRFAITLTRTIAGVNYTLPPNDPRYVLPIPPDVIAQTGMEQNPR